MLKGPPIPSDPSLPPCPPTRQIFIESTYHTALAKLASSKWFGGRVA